MATPIWINSPTVTAPPVSRQMASNTRRDGTTDWSRTRTNVDADVPHRRASSRSDMELSSRNLERSINLYSGIWNDSQELSLNLLTSLPVCSMIRNRHEQIMKQIKDAIKLARERKGLSLKDAAKLIGISKSSLYRLESGEGRVSMEHLQTVARGYGYLPGAMLDGNLDTMPELDMSVVAEAVRTVLEASEPMKPRPEPSRIAATVVEVIRLVNQDRDRNPTSDANPSRYLALVQASLGRFPRDPGINVDACPPDKPRQTTLG